MLLEVIENIEEGATVVSTLTFDKATYQFHLIVYMIIFIAKSITKKLRI